MADADIYRSARLMMNRYGPQAAEHAEQTMRRLLEEDDPQGAGKWLSIGQAIEDLTRLAAAGSRH